MEFISAANKIKAQLGVASNILVIGHQQPDADALGSLMAIGFWLDQLGKQHIKFCKDAPQAALHWIVNFQPITTDPALVTQQQFDTVIFLDSGDIKYAGVSELLPALPTKPTIINIDHHATNQLYGHINLVDASAASTTEIIYQLFSYYGVAFPPSVASALLAGIILDTYNFTNPNTTYRSLETAGALLLAGASLPHVSDSVLKNKSVGSLHVWGKALERLCRNKQYNIASTIIADSDIPTGVSVAEVTEGTANFLNNLSDIKAALILQQLPDGTIKGSLRTNDPLIDVSKLATLLGGGGHKKAAGFKLPGRLVQTAEGYWQIE